MYQEHLEWDIHSCSGEPHTFQSARMWEVKLVYLQFSPYLLQSMMQDSISRNPVHNTIFST